MPLLAAPAIRTLAAALSERRGACTLTCRGGGGVYIVTRSPAGQISASFDYHGCVVPVEWDEVEDLEGWE